MLIRHSSYFSCRSVRQCTWHWRQPAPVNPLGSCVGADTQLSQTATDYAILRCILNSWDGAETVFFLPVQSLFLSIPICAWDSYVTQEQDQQSSCLKKQSNLYNLSYVPTQFSEISCYHTKPWCQPNFRKFPSSLFLAYMSLERWSYFKLNTFEIYK